MNSRASASFIMAISALLFAISPILAKLGNRDPIVTVGFRSLVCCVIFISFFRVSGIPLIWPKGWHHWGTILLRIASNLLFFAGTMIGNAGSATLIFFCFPLVAMLAELFGKERHKPKLEEVVVLIFGILGLIIIFGQSFNTQLLLGSVLALVGGIVCGIQMFLTHRLKTSNERCNILLHAELLNMLFLIFALKETSWPSKNEWYCLLLLGLASGVALFALAKSYKYLRAYQIGTILLVQPMSTPFFGHLLVNESISRATYLGGIIVLASLGGRAFIRR